MVDKIELSCNFKFDQILIQLYEQKLFNHGALTVPPKYHRITCLRGGNVASPQVPGKGGPQCGIFTGSKRVITISNNENTFIQAIAHRVISEVVYWFLNIDSFYNDEFNKFLQSGLSSDFTYGIGLYEIFNKVAKDIFYRPLDEPNWSRLERVEIITNVITRWRNGTIELPDVYQVPMCIIEKQCSHISLNRRIAVPRFTEIGDCLFGVESMPLHAISYVNLIDRACHSHTAHEIFENIYELPYNVNKVKEFFVGTFVPESIDAHLRWFSGIYSAETIYAAREYFSDRSISIILGEQISFFILTLMARFMIYTAMTNDGKTSSSLLFNVFSDAVAVITESYGTNMIVLREDLRILYKQITVK